MAEMFSSENHLGQGQNIYVKVDPQNVQSHLVSPRSTSTNGGLFETSDSDNADGNMMLPGHHLHHSANHHSINRLSVAGSQVHLSPGDNSTGNVSPTSGDEAHADGDAENIWPPHVELAFQEALELYPPCGRRKLPSNDADGKMKGRNELIASYILKKTGVVRSRKQVSSHIQVLNRRNKKRDGQHGQHVSVGGGGHAGQQQHVSMFQLPQQQQQQHLGRPSYGVSHHRAYATLPPPSHYDTTPLVGSHVGPNLPTPQQHHLQQQQQHQQSYGRVPVGQPSTTTANGAVFDHVASADDVCFALCDLELTGSTPCVEEGYGVDFRRGPAKHYVACVRPAPLSIQQPEMRGAAAGFSTFTCPSMESVLWSQVREKFPPAERDANGVAAIMGAASPGVGEDLRFGMSHEHLRGGGGVAAARQRRVFLLKLWIHVESPFQTDQPMSDACQFMLNTTYKSVKQRNLLVRSSIYSALSASEPLKDEVRIDRSAGEYDSTRRCFVYRQRDVPACRFVAKFLLRLRAEPTRERRDHVLEFLSVTQLVFDADTDSDEPLLALAFIFCMSMRDEPNFRVYRLMNP